MKHVYIVLFFIAITIASCTDMLDVTRLDVVSSDQVWNDETLIEAYYGNLYSRANFIFGLDETTSTNFFDKYYGAGHMGSEGTNRQKARVAYTDGRLAADNTDIPIGNWDYGFIRDVNTAIENLNASTSFSEDFKNQKLGEAYFMRAFSYFEMVKRYGGVPIVTTVQNPSADIETLQIPRSTEEEVYRFIESELDKAYELLSGRQNHKTYITEWAVLCLKSRAMLYAGSIAANNSKLTYTKDGLVGIDPSKAEAFYQSSLNASQKLTDLGGFSLQVNDNNQIDNFRKLFIEDNDEIIMLMEFTGAGGRYNNLEALLHPRVTAYEYWGNMFSPYLENLEAFEYMDGTPGNMLYGTDITWREAFKKGNFYSLDQLFGAKDARLLASIAVPQTEYIGEPIYYHLSVTDPDYAKANAVPLKCQNQNTGPNAGHTGFGQVKFLNGVPWLLGEGSSDVPIFRLGEIYLNYAEAALGLEQHLSEGLKYLNDIRARAGLVPHSSLTFDAIVQERRVELMFEHHRFWDLRRWRLAEEYLNSQLSGVDWVWNVEANTYQLTMKKNVEQFIRQFRPEHYYFPIPQNVVRDDKLEQNPGYSF
ncbi:RagB/SusD family nutrient uptake outer membrane protein [Mariniphaga sediminis]|uniref:RagB/SusD family nutrient uptake outer membrane protein n=1 Tax=Mariniphaga sediminis TaxID=1628158 RepID=A0A399CZT7_9BACT|nr:RagB/SusD family nutrient uptake outer membrane protein [Mariniphaga sediminis]RIH64746.1 RagB/SusD family nutrient uptake outer membrane protein [Mariniphaga sediminis]